MSEVGQSFIRGILPETPPNIAKPVAENNDT
jgi:hypothetical protein